MTESHVDRYRQLFTQIGQEPAGALFDRLQVLALTQPDTIREFTALIDRGQLEQRFFHFPNPIGGAIRIGDKRPSFPKKNAVVWYSV